MASAGNPITPRAFQFLRELARHNDRDWFNANKPRYLADVRDPLLAFIAAVEPELALEGKLFRIHRDTRFAKDKSPYKTRAAIAFRGAEGGEAPSPAFYLHLEPGSVFAGAGIWHPSPETLKQVRDAIVAQPERWQRVTRAKGCALDDDDERLSRPPRGYDPAHPRIEDLKRKSFTTSKQFAERDACSADFVRTYAVFCRRALPLMAFLALQRPESVR